MTKRAWRLGILAWALVLPVPGCGGGKSCEELCNAREACPDVFPSDTPCKEQCIAQEKLVKAGGCEAQQADFDECVSKLEDPCTAAQDCPTQAKLSNGCITDYCEASPTSCPAK